MSISLLLPKKQNADWLGDAWRSHHHLSACHLEYTKIHSPSYLSDNVWEVSKSTQLPDEKVDDSDTELRPVRYARQQALRRVTAWVCNYVVVLLIELPTAKCCCCCWIGASSRTTSRRAWFSNWKSRTRNVWFPKLPRLLEQIAASGCGINAVCPSLVCDFFYFGCDRGSNSWIQRDRHTSTREGTFLEVSIG